MSRSPSQPQDSSTQDSMHRALRRMTVDSTAVKIDDLAERLMLSLETWKSSGFGG